MPLSAQERHEINDLAQQFEAATGAQVVAARERIGAALKAHEAKTTNQIAVLTIATLGEDNIGHYATRVFETWKPGKKDKDNGLLLVIVPKERKIRFEVGRRLKGTVPDVVASRTIRNVIAPQFKANQFDKGVEDGLAAVIKLLEGDPGASRGRGFGGLNHNRDSWSSSSGGWSASGGGGDSFSGGGGDSGGGGSSGDY